MKSILHTGLILIAFNAFSQAQNLSDLAGLEDLLNEADFGSGASVKVEDGYKSPVQNEYQNIVKQLSDFDTQLEEELFN